MKTRAQQILSHIKGPSILHVGCAGQLIEPQSAYWLHGQLCKSFPMVCGIDINERAIRELTSLGYQGIYLANAESFSLERKFDTIFAGEVIEHVSNPGLFLEQAKDHLAACGRIVITTPYPFSLLYSLYAHLKFPKTCQNREHTCWFCLQTFKELARRASFRITHWELLEDYRLDDPSKRYRFFVWLIRVFGWLVPKRLRCNTMLLILEREEGC